MAEPGRAETDDAERAGNPPAPTMFDVPAVVLGTVGGAAVAWVHRNQALTAVLLVVLVAIATWLSVIDLRERRLPNKIVGPLALVTTMVVLVAGVVGDDLGRTRRALLVGAIAVIVCFVANLAGGMGMGDVKYSFPLFTVIGWFGGLAVNMTVLTTALAGGLVGIVLVATGRGRKFRLPYGPFMSLGLVAGLVTAGLL